MVIAATRILPQVESAAQKTIRVETRMNTVEQAAKTPMVSVTMVVESLEVDVVWTITAQDVKRVSVVRRKENVVGIKAHAGVVASSHSGTVGRQISCSHRCPVPKRTMLRWTPYQTRFSLEKPLISTISMILIFECPVMVGPSARSII